MNAVWQIWSKEIQYCTVCVRGLYSDGQGTCCKIKKSVFISCSFKTFGPKIDLLLGYNTLEAWDVLHI